MLSSESVLDRYVELVKQHGERFNPRLVRLQEQVELEMATLREEEVELVVAQKEVLEELKMEIAADAMFLVKKEGFQRFVGELGVLEFAEWSSRGKLVLDR